MKQSRLASRQIVILQDQPLTASETQASEKGTSVKKLRSANPFLLLLIALIVFDAAISAGAFGQKPSSSPDSAVPRPNPTGTDPKPENATEAILAAFDKYEVVAMDSAHGNKDLDDFILDLIRNPDFPGKVNDIAVECGNSLYQPILDRYIAGDDVPLSEVQLTWRNTTQPMCGLSSFYEQFFPLVRRINQKLSPEKRLRVLAGDPAIDWSKVQSRDDVPIRLRNRDASIASVMKNEVLSKHRKVLMLFGTFHLFHSGTLFPSAVQLYEKEYPGVTLVIADHVGFGNWTPLAKYNGEFEARMASWPVPSLVQHLQGTWLASLLDADYSSGAVHIKLINGISGTQARITPIVLEGYSRMIDAYLYLGPRDLQLLEPPAQTLLDKDYMAELHRRATVLGEEESEKISDESTPFLYDPYFLERATQNFCQSHPSTPCVIGQGVEVGLPH